MTGEIRKCFQNISEENKSSLLSILNGKHKIIVASHKNPDGDAIGSALGIAGALKNAGHQVEVVIPDMVPSFLNWLPGYKKVTVYEFQAEKVLRLVKEADLLIILDLSHPDRMGDMQSILSEFNGLSLQIDHHPGSGGFTTISAIDHSSGSTSELIYNFLEWAGFIEYLDKDNATCMLTGIITDTLGFKVASSYPGVFSVVMKLMEAGADKDMAFDQIYNQYSENRFKLLGFSLESRMKVFPEKGAAYIYL
ncbi:MAG: DHH family phosphoesterase, partial [Bacteroidales bacterium]|nr:DHH family phosphoesterase [Bacteroidales bacterium]